MGLSESSLNTIIKPFSFLSHCNISCDSPCCETIFLVRTTIASVMLIPTKTFSAMKNT